MPVDDRIITAFNDGAAHYAAAGVPLLTPHTDLILERLQLSPGQAVVDLACGTGAIALPAARQVGARGSVMGIDLSERQLEIARRAAPPGPTVRFQRGDAGAPPLADRSADAVACGLGLPYFREPLRALRAAVRIARPGAPVVWSTWRTPFLGPPGERLLWALIRNDIPPPLPELTHTSESLARLAFRAGLRGVVIEEHEIEFGLPSFDDWWDMLRAFALLASVDADAARPPPEPLLHVETQPEPPLPIRDQLRADVGVVDADGAVSGRMRLLLLCGTG